MQVLCLPPLPCWLEAAIYTIFLKKIFQDLLLTVPIQIQDYRVFAWPFSVLHVYLFSLRWKFWFPVKPHNYSFAFINSLRMKIAALSPTIWLLWRVVFVVLSVYLIRDFIHYCNLKSLEIIYLCVVCHPVDTVWFISFVCLFWFFYSITVVVH